MPLLRRASGGGSRRTSSTTLTPSRWHHEGIPLVVIQRQLGHANLGITSIYLQGIDSSEIIDTVHARPAPTISATAGLSQL
jgi:integrase